MKKTRLQYAICILSINAILAIDPLCSSAQSAKPNLTLFDVAVPQEGLVMSETSTFSTTIFNNGTAPSTACVFKLYASEDEFRDAKDKVIATVKVMAIPADSFISMANEFVVPITIPRYTTYIFGVIDADNTVDESDEGDNQGSGRTSVDQRASFGKLHVTSNNNNLGTWKIVDFPKSFKFNTIVEDVPKGPERITFSEVAGYEKPADTTVIVLQGKTTLLYVEYKKITTALGEGNVALIKTAYPNPASDDFYLETFSAKIIEVKIFDMQGREFPAESEVILNQASINLSELCNGIYMVRVQTEQGFSTVRMVKK